MCIKLIIYYLIDDSNFDEIITFNHTYLKFRLFETLTTKIEEFPFLTNNEYLLVGTNFFINYSF